MHDNELEEVIFQLLQASMLGKDQCANDFPKETLHELIRSAGRLFLDEPILLNLSGPIKIVGDIHGNLKSLIRILQSFDYPPKSTYLFLGDYIDRGKSPIEVLILLYALKLLYPSNIFLLRGNHETPQVAKRSNFRECCAEQVSKKAFSLFLQSFSALPLAAVVNGVFCVHGGISPNIGSIDSISTLKRPLFDPKLSKHPKPSFSSLNDNPITKPERVKCPSNPSSYYSEPTLSKENEINLSPLSPDYSLDLLWSDPSPSTTEFSSSPRNFGFLFGKVALNSFLAMNKLKGIVRGHAFCKSGYTWPFGTEIPCLTVFSSHDYCGFGNPSAIAVIANDGTITPFLVPTPSRDRVIFPEWLFSFIELPPNDELPENDGFMIQYVSI